MFARGSVLLNFRNHGDDLTCVGQISADQVSILAAQGFRTIVCNRPDGEAGAVASVTIAAAAREHGLVFVHQPVLFSTLNLADGARFAKVLDEADKPVLAYCRTGRRSAALWVMGRAPTLGVDAALAASKAVGCDLEELRTRVASALD